MIELPELEKEVAKIWPHSERWRLNNGVIEWSLRDVWFPVYRAPTRVEKFVLAWKKAGGLSEACS